MLGPAHADKRGAERVLAHCAGWTWDDAEHGVVRPEILSGNWQAGLPQPGSIRATSVKAAMLTDGACRGDAADAKKQPYRVKERALGSAWTIARQDVAHFIVEELIKGDGDYRDVSIAY